MGLDAMILVFWMLSLKPTFSLSSFIKRLFSSSSLSAIRVVSSAYLRLSIFLLEILIPPGASSSPAFLIMYSAYKLNKQGDSIQPWRTPFPIWNQSVVPCPVLTVASWPAYRFLKRQISWSGISISFRIFQFIVIHTVKGFGIVKCRNIFSLLQFSFGYSLVGVLSVVPSQPGEQHMKQTEPSRPLLSRWKVTLELNGEDQKWLLCPAAPASWPLLPTLSLVPHSQNWWCSLFSPLVSMWGSPLSFHSPFVLVLLNCASVSFCCLQTKKPDVSPLSFWLKLFIERLLSIYYVSGTPTRYEGLHSGKKEDYLPWWGFQ